VTPPINTVEGPEVGSWIYSALGGGLGPRVKEQIPQGYDRYVRVFHPVSDRDGNPVTWSEVAERTGKVSHPLMQWHCIVGAQFPHSMLDADWPGPRPALGELEAPSLDVLCSKLARQTSTVDHCFFGLSTIHGVIEKIAEGKPLLHFPHRDFVIFCGPLSAAGELALDSGQAGAIQAYESESQYLCLSSGVGQPPNLMWPSDRAWFVATEIDFDSTLVGGDQTLIGEILNDELLEACPVNPNDSLAEDADKINCQEKP
jgi:hypothetical protein